MNRPAKPLEWTVPINLACENDFVLGQFEVCPSRSQVLVNRMTETVEPRVMQALVVLAQRKGQVVSRDELVGRCWGGRVVSEDAIHRCIAKVRKLGELDRNGSFAIDTVPRVGYQLNEIHSDGVQGLGASLDQLATEPILAASIRKEGYGQYNWPILGAAVLTVSLTAAAILWLFRPTVTQAPTLNNRLAAVTVAAGGSSALPAGAIFKDCTAGCPEMVVIPPGAFLMGSAYEDPERRASEIPQHAVTIRYSFSVSRYLITREEYARFATETGRPDGNDDCYAGNKAGLWQESPGTSWRDPGFKQTPRDPVLCINWFDAEAYASWLAARTGKHYRLLSEAEWEYAARSGMTGTRPAPLSRICSVLNSADADYHAHYPGDPLFDGACRDGYGYTSPVGAFPPNPFGLFDMLGNAGQWTADCYNQSYDGAPSDGSAWTKGDCTQRVVRGSPWLADSKIARFVTRHNAATGGRTNANGFRVARAL